MGVATLIFTYGTLKQGFSNHALLQDLISTGDAAFVRAARTLHPLPLLPFLLNLEGIGWGHYERLPIQIEAETETVEAYYAHGSYAEAMWRRSGGEAYNCYTEKAAKGYVKRMDRPQHLTFLDQIALFLSSSATRLPPFPTFCFFTFFNNAWSNNYVKKQKSMICYSTQMQNVKYTSNMPSI